ncbi:hypothetical protein SLS60_008886 [Paraconiothyrium brasiliense]|uniref:Uncharacterized protein n=1 Tax=Paraconiothyrium brasiliense TaxID=300254 RepID=A0ABR3QYR7_9PLEO
MQIKSPIFCIPRELRDHIYTYYVYEEDGYFHDFASGKLTRSHQQPIDLGLTFTCKPIAKELRGLALRINQITFTTGRSEDDDNTPHDEYRGFRSRAGRYESLLALTRVAKMQMLMHASECITPAVLRQIEERHAEDGSFFTDHFRATCEYGPIGSFEDSLEGFVGYMTKDASEVPPSFRSALDTALTLASADPRFTSLARKAFDKDLNSPKWRTIFRSKAFDLVLKWQPAPWHIPSSNELSMLEALLSDPDEAIHHSYRGEWGAQTDYSVGVWYFSATAVAIELLKRLSTRGLRACNIVIQEDRKAVAHPAYHARD